MEKDARRGVVVSNISEIYFGFKGGWQVKKATAVNYTAFFSAQG